MTEVNPKMLLISLNEAKREFNNPSRMRTLYKEVIEPKNPKIIFICTQHSKSKAIIPKHFQHVFGEYLEENGYKKLDKYDASFYIPGYKDNTSARTRIYTLKDNNPLKITDIKFSISDNMGKTSEGSKNRQGILTSFTITNKDNRKKFNIINTELEKRSGTKYDFKREGELAGLIKDFFKPTNDENFIICGSLYFNPHILDFISKSNIASSLYGNKLENYMNSEGKKYDALQEHMKKLKNKINIPIQTENIVNLVNLVNLYKKFSQSIKENKAYNNCFGDEYDGYSLGQFVNNSQNFFDSVPTKFKGITEEVRQGFRNQSGRGWSDSFKSFTTKVSSIVKKKPEVENESIEFNNKTNIKLCNRILYALQNGDNSKNEDSIIVYNKKIGYYEDTTKDKTLHAHKLIYKYFDL